MLTSLGWLEISEEDKGPPPFPFSKNAGARLTWRYRESAIRNHASTGIISTGISPHNGQADSRDAVALLLRCWQERFLPAKRVYSEANGGAEESPR